MAATVLATVVLLAVAAAGCASSAPTVAHPPQTTGRPSSAAPAVALARDESVLSSLYDGCGGTCRYETVETTDGAGGTLYAIEVTDQFEDGYGRGAVFFFRGESLLARTGGLAPGTSVHHGSGLDGVLDPEAGKGISVPSPEHVAVTFVVSSAANLCNACDGDAGTDTYTYRWNGSALVLGSGTPPAPPAVIGDGSQ